MEGYSSAFAIPFLPMSTIQDEKNVVYLTASGEILLLSTKEVQEREAVFLEQRRKRIREELLALKAKLEACQDKSGEIRLQMLNNFLSVYEK